VNVNKKIFSICLSVVVLVALIAVLVQGCGDGNGDGATYDLTMAANPTACGTATDETNASPYEEGADVDIKAVAAACCRFVDWTAPDGSFGNATAAETTFTMPARDVTVTANFEPIPLNDHFWCYWAMGMPLGEEGVQLEDQFVTINATVLEPYLFGNPAEKVHDDVTTPISDPNNHFTWYSIVYEEEPQMWEVTVQNQFGLDQMLLVGGPFWLAVPTEKVGHEMPECLDHYLVYQVEDYMGQYPGVPVLLSDQFYPEPMQKMVYQPWYFANPVQKTHDGKITEIGNSKDHLVFYLIDGGVFVTEELPIVNQFGPQFINVYEDEGDILGVPSEKISWTGPYPYEMP
jgi:hypothetical protein